MKYFESKQIHSSLSAFSTADIMVYRELTRKSYNERSGEKTYSSKYGFAITYAPSDKRFYHEMRGVDKAVIQDYAQRTYLDNGWIEQPEWLAEQRSKLWKDEEDVYVAKRIKQGYVIPRWEKDLPVASYQGGFSDKVFNDEYLQRYLAGGGCHGYIGHATRRPQTDAYLESQWLKKNNDVSLLAMWLTSSGGRHFADWKEGQSLAEQKTYIKESVVRLVEQAEGYRRAE